MSVRKKAQSRGSQNTIVLALLLAAPAAASQLGSPDSVAAPVTAAAPAATPPAATLIAQPDPRARDAWVRECRRRLGYEYDDGDQPATKPKKRKAGDPPRESGYDYCQAHFDEYTRNYRPQPQQTAAAAKPSQSVSEVITYEYVTVPRRTVKHRAKPRHKSRAQ